VSQNKFVIDEVAPESRGTFFLLGRFSGSLACTVSVTVELFWRRATPTHSNHRDSGDDAVVNNTA